MQSPLVLILRTSQRSQANTQQLLKSVSLLLYWINSSSNRASQRAHGFAFEALGVTAQSSTVARSGQTTNLFTSLVGLTRAQSTGTGPILRPHFSCVRSLPPVPILRVFRPYYIFHGGTWYGLSKNQTSTSARPKASLNRRCRRSSAWCAR